MDRLTVVLISALSFFLVGSSVLRGDDERSEELAAALSSAKVSLEAGLEAASAAGKPISAKFEIEESKLQLSVYVSNDGAFSEVIVDHRTGKVSKVELITEGEDLEEATAQDQAMAGAKSGLAVVVARVLGTNKRFLVVSAVPAVEGGHPVVKVTLVKGENWKTLTEKLD